MASMSTIGLGCGGGEKLLYNNGGYNWFDQVSNCPNSMVAMNPVMKDQRKQINRGRISAISMTCDQQSPILSQNLFEQNQSNDDHHHQQTHDETLERWMRDSVVEIVRNLREAPLLLHVYDGDQNKTTSLKVEKMVEDEIWPRVISQRPEGVIFVEKLEGKPPSPERLKNEVTPGEESVVGVVVQGRGRDVGPAYYLLKTTRVGPACHYCLVRVTNFRDTAKKHFEDFWLVKNFNTNHQSW